jgi:preprotein translocase subunit SecD
MVSIIWNLPNFVDVSRWPAWPFKSTINFGLDIQGGLHLVMGVDVKSVISESTNRLTRALLQTAKEENIRGITSSTLRGHLGEFSLNFEDPSGIARMKELIARDHLQQLQLIEESESSLTYKFFESYLNEYRDRVLDQAVITIRNRIDEFGVAEPSITKQGTDRILVQLPGMEDAESAKALIKTAARLEFMGVIEKDISELQGMIARAEEALGVNLSGLRYSEYIQRINDYLKPELPENSMILFEKAPNATSLEMGRIPYLVKTDSGIGGSDLDDARVDFHHLTGTPEVDLRFNPVGAVKFRELSSQYLKKRVAIVLDRVIKTAPTINDVIGTGRARITLGGTVREEILNEAKMIATSLRAGALPASLEQLEERRVGPSLGRDALLKAEIAAMVGFSLICLFMMIRYKAMGVITNLALILNVSLILGLLNWIGATLTLPGIAGIALIIGVAVDANVLINERIREELTRGAQFTLALREGYSRALSAILDANLTVAATAGILLYFGTGPVRGFAVTLLIGILTTLVANVYSSKVVVDWLVIGRGWKKLSV